MITATFLVSRVRRSLPLGLLFTFFVSAVVPAAEKAPVVGGPVFFAPAGDIFNFSSPFSSPVPAGSQPQNQPLVPSPPPPVIPDRRQPVMLKPTLVYHGETLTEDTVWNGEVFVNPEVTVAPQATLTITPGTVVRFGPGSAGNGAEGILLVQGRLIANGSPEKPIVFTSSFVEPNAGDWQGITFLASEKKNSLENCRVEGATVGIRAFYTTLSVKNTEIVTTAGSGIHVTDCVLSVTGGGIRGARTGLLLEESEADVRGVIFTENAAGITAIRSSLHLQDAVLEKNGGSAVSIENSRLTISGNRILNNGGSGIRLSACEGSVTANSISGNAAHGLQLAKSRMKISGNSLEQNGINGLHVEEGGVVAWGNTLAGNGGYDCYNAGSDEVQAMGNWWGSTNGAEVGRRIYDRRVDATRGKVAYQPILRVRPPRIP